jgi:transposase-like protein
MTAFTPPFCARVSCIHHEPKNHSPYQAYRPWGFYNTKTFGKVPRYRCNSCGKTFSRQTFSLDYYAKRILSYQDIVQRLSSCESLSAIGRALVSSTDTISNRISRAARQALALSSTFSSSIHPDEDLAADGFESFCHSQYFPNNITLLVGASSQYVYAADHVTLRRKGRMTKVQKKKRAELETRWKARPGGIEHSFRRIADEAIRVYAQGRRSPLTLWTDEHQSYAMALTHSPHHALLIESGFLRHQVVSSRAARTTSNPLFPVNYLDRELRKDLHEHVRETVCFGRNVNRQMERLSVYLLWHNTIKRHRAREGPRKNVEMTGCTTEVDMEELKHIWVWRAWRSLTELSDAMRETWERLRDTPLSRKPDYLPRYALM